MVTLEARCALGEKCINQIQDYFEYRYKDQTPEQIRNWIFQQLEDYSEELQEAAEVPEPGLFKVGDRARVTSAGATISAFKLGDTVTVNSLDGEHTVECSLVSDPRDIQWFASKIGHRLTLIQPEN